MLLNPIAERAAWLALALAPGSTPRGAHQLVARHGTAWQAWQQGRPPDGDPLTVLNRLQNRGQRVVAPSDPEYPAHLLHLHDPPTVLFVRGRALPVQPGVAVVGSRRASCYGKALASSLGRDLSRAGLPLVSGLARGIDGAAHEGSLQAAEGHPVAVLGCGLDVDYPPEHARLKRRIEEAGTLVSEHPPGTPPTAWHFPARNRILAALSRAVVVVEAAGRSGALITARLGLELGREVMAVPGMVGSPTSEGTLQLLKDGAALVRDARDVLRELGLPDPEPRPPAPLEHEASLVLAALPSDGASVDRLRELSGLPVDRVMTWLARLELSGLVQRHAGGRFVPVPGALQDTPQKRPL